MHVPSNGSKGRQIAGKYPSYSQVSSAECIVTAVRYPDDEFNISKTYTEYDVRDIKTGQSYANCRRLHLSSGLDDGDDNTLRAAQRSLVNRGGSFDPKVGPAITSDGDRVMVMFLYGAYTNPVIIGALSHARAVYSNTRKHGARRFTIHKGTSLEIQSDGTAVLTRHTKPSAPGSPQVPVNTTTITVSPNGDIELAHESGAKLSLLANGSLTVEGVGSNSVNLGDSASEHVIKGESFMATFNALVRTVNSLAGDHYGHFHQDSATAPTGGPISLPLVPVALGPPVVYSPGIPQPATAPANNMPASDLSNKVRTE